VGHFPTLRHAGPTPQLAGPIPPQVYPHECWMLDPAGTESDGNENAERSAEAGHFQGIDGATSLKEEITGRIPKLNNAATFRSARQLLQQLGGAVALRDELVFAGFVDPETGQLTTNSKPFNVFAQMAAGRMQQDSLVVEQQALGDHRSKFLICANRADSDMYWDSEDPYWVSKASMSRRHRFLTTLDLHWQWFNMLVAGLVPPEHGGVDVDTALQEVESMRAAALQFAKTVGGWSDQVGLYVNIFGHNNVNSLFIHILDMSQLGPGFGFQSFKSCPLDDVLQVLREEAGGDKVSSVIQPSVPPVAKVGWMTHKRQGDGNFFFAGTDGATSLKAELVGRVPILRDAASFREARRLLREELGGALTVGEELYRCGFLDVETGLLTTGDVPFNVWARVATGKMIQPGMESEQKFLGEYQDEFMICCNKKESDETWESEDPEHIGKASMSKRHRFLTTKSIHWQWFNALVFGLVPPECGGTSLQEAVDTVQRMKAAALKYTSSVGGWGETVGLYFHVFGHNSVNSLHMHILDLAELGPTFWVHDYKNCPVEAVIKVLKEEFAREQRQQQQQQQQQQLQQQMVSSTSYIGSSTASMVGEASVPPPRMTIKGRMNRNFMTRSREQELMHLSIGGEVVSIPREALLLAPKESRLHKTFELGWDGPQLTMDAEGRIILEYPPRSFRIIIDHFRQLHQTPQSEMLTRPIVEEDLECEFRDLARLLGVDDFLLGDPGAGAAKDSQLRPPSTGAS